MENLNPNPDGAMLGEEKPKLFMSLETTEEFLIKRSRANIAEFIAYISDGEHTPAVHHLEWLYSLVEPTQKFVNIIAPRGSAKTTMLTYLLAWLIGKFPLKTHAIFSASQDLADKRLRDVRDMLETNERYRNVFPWIEIDRKYKTTSSEFTIKCSRWKGKTIPYSTWRKLVGQHGQRFTPTLLSKGIQGSGIAGNRFTGLILLDDIHDEKNSATSEQRAKVVNSVKKVIQPCLWKEAEPKMASICTRWAEDDYPGTIMAEKRRSGDMIWKTIEIPAIDDDGNSYWKELWSLDRLEEVREEIGEVMFQLMYMLNPKAVTSSEFSIDMLRQVIPNDPVPDFKEVFISCDFAETMGLESDYTVYAAVARDHKKIFNYYILDIVRFKRSRVSDKVDKLITFVDDIFGTYGKFTAVLMEQRDSATEANELRAVRADIPVRIIPVKGDKGDRMQPLAAAGQKSRIYTNTLMKEYNAMCSELIGFPARHDDIKDALDLPFQQPSWATIYERVGSVEFPSDMVLI